MSDQVDRNQYNVGSVSGGVNAIGENAQINVNVSSFSEFSSIDEKTKAKLIASYQSATNSVSSSAQLNLAVGLHYLDSGLYAESVEALQLARRNDPINKNVLYYLALATIAGKPLRSATLTQIREAEGYIQSATQLQSSQAHYYYLWCLIKFDFYRANGFRETVPNIEELIILAVDSYLEKKEIIFMLEHVRVTDSPIIKHLINLL